MSVAEPPSGHAGTAHLLGSSSSTFRIVSLDVLRAVAVLMVLASHLDPPPESVDWISRGLSAFFRSYGGLGVDLFFVLSGFLVSGLLFKEAQLKGTLSIRRFLVRRGLKIYPAFYAFLIITVGLRTLYGDRISATRILSESMFVQNYGPYVWSHTWSLAVEEHFYLLLAGTFFLLWRSQGRESLRRIPVLFTVVTLTVLTARVGTYLWIPASPKAHRFPTHLQIDSLAFGVLLAYYYHTHERFREIPGRHARALMLVGLGVLFTSHAALHGMAAYTLGHIAVYLGFGAIVIGAVCATGTTIAAIRWPMLALGYLGSYSYSIYLWHTAVLVFGSILARKSLGFEMNWYALSACYLTASIVFGIIMAKCVEIPVLGLRDRWFPSGVGDLACSAPAPLGGLGTEFKSTAIGVASPALITQNQL